MIRRLFLATVFGLGATPLLAAAPSATKAAGASASLPASNPFAKPSKLPFQAPDFSAIKDSDYLPAILAGMAEQKKEVAAITEAAMRGEFPEIQWLFFEPDVRD